MRKRFGRRGLKRQSVKGKRGRRITRYKHTRGGIRL